MKKMRTVEIDFDLHKLIETERDSFDETPNDVLRRLLGLGETMPTHTPSAHERTPASIAQLSELQSTGRSWSDEGVTLTHGTSLRMTYSGRTYEGQIVNGKWMIRGQLFDSPSGAASGIALTRKGTKTRLDGWIYWHVKRPGDPEWIALDSLRPQPHATTLEDLGLL